MPIVNLMSNGEAAAGAKVYNLAQNIFLLAQLQK